MAKAPLNAAVSLSRSPVGETPRHPAQFRDRGETPSETSPLKALARRVLDRDTRRDNTRDSLSRYAPPIEVTTETPVSTVSVVDDINQRAALIEYGAGVPQAWAEGYAALSTIPAPAGFSSERWFRIVDAAGIFIDRYAGVAIECGWSDLDVFGCDPDRPDARFDCMGLVLLLDRCEIIGIDEDGADLVTETGTCQRYRRRPLPVYTVSLWVLGRDD
jgi:hypothetical protein